MYNRTVINRLVAYIERLNGIGDKNRLAEAVKNEFDLIQDRKVYYCEDFAIRFSKSESRRMSNTVLSLSALQKYDFRDLGAEIYKQAAEEPGSMPKAVVLSDKARTAIGSIARHKIRFQTMKDEFAKANQCVVCPSCGTMVDKNAAYCSACGAKMAPDEEAGGEDAPDTKDTDGSIPID